MKLLSLLVVLAAVRAWNVEEAPAEGWRRVIIDIEHDDGVPKWVSPEEVQKLVDFVDITDHQDWKRVDNQLRQSYPTTPAQRDTVARVASLGSEAEMQTNLKALTNDFTNRYYTGFGRDSAIWIERKLNEYVIASGRSDATVRLFTHTWPQPSVIARIQGSNTSLPMLILGAHEDSVNHRSNNPATARAPGADDDGSGTVTVMEAFRVFLNSGYQPLHTIEFQLYAAEEVGLRGSAAIAQDYANRGVQVRGMLQFDMNGYCATRTRALIMRRTSVDVALSNFLNVMINEYSDMTNQDTNGAYNSDHGSWTRSGYPASHCKEAGGYPYIHTDDDSEHRMKYDCMNEFLKISAGFLIELDLF